MNKILCTECIYAVKWSTVKYTSVRVTIATNMLMRSHNFSYNIQIQYTRRREIHLNYLYNGSGY